MHLQVLKLHLVPPADRPLPAEFHSHSHFLILLRPALLTAALTLFRFTFQILPAFRQPILHSFLGFCCSAQCKLSVHLGAVRVRPFPRLIFGTVHSRLSPQVLTAFQFVLGTSPFLAQVGSVAHSL